MPSPRIRRLILDEQRLQQVFRNWHPIQITGTAGMPPEIYRFTYNLRGLYVSPGGEILERDVHLLEVNLTLGYPRRAPQCRMLTPVFHPNFDDSMVCIGDFWAASEGLDDLIIRIGRMIAYQEYNTKSPLNGLAAKWAAQNPQLLPVGGLHRGPRQRNKHTAADDVSNPLAARRHRPPDRSKRVPCHRNRSNVARARRARRAFPAPARKTSSPLRCQ